MRIARDRFGRAHGLGMRSTSTVIHCVAQLVEKLVLVARHGNHSRIGPNGPIHCNRGGSFERSRVRRDRKSRSENGFVR